MNTRRFTALVGVVAAAASVGLMGVVAPVEAAAPEATGWWWAAKPGGPTPPIQPPSPPVVPAGGMYVASEPTDPVGLSAVRLTIPDNAAVGDLVLKVDSMVGTAVVQACTTTTAWSPEEGGRLDAAPVPDCATGLAYGGLEADNTAMRFPVGGLVRNGVLNLVLMPQTTTTVASQAVPPHTTPFQVVFEKPDDQAISMTVYESDTSESAEEELEDFTAAFAEDLGGLIDTDAPPFYEELALPAPVTVAPSAPASGPSRTIPAAALPPRAERDNRASRIVAAVVFAGLLLTYLALMYVPGRLPPRLAGVMGRVVPVDMHGGEEQAVARGIGRFARPRDHPPLKL